MRLPFPNIRWDSGERCARLVRSRAVPQSQFRRTVEVNPFRAIHDGSPNPVGQDIHFCRVVATRHVSSQSLASFQRTKGMPYKLVKSRGKDAYFVVTASSGRKHSLSPLPRRRAEAQMRALYAAENGYVLRNRSMSRRRMGRGRVSRRRDPSRRRSPSRRR